MLFEERNAIFLEKDVKKSVAYFVIINELSVPELIAEAAARLGFSETAAAKAIRHEWYVVTNRILPVGCEYIIKVWRPKIEIRAVQTDYIPILLEESLFPEFWIVFVYENVNAPKSFSLPKIARAKPSRKYTFHSLIVKHCLEYFYTWGTTGHWINLWFEIWFANSKKRDFIRNLLLIDSSQIDELGKHLNLLEMDYREVNTLLKICMKIGFKNLLSALKQLKKIPKEMWFDYLETAAVVS